jgi:regulator of PEP synthase PpsR (kinase-PPPase family)
MFGLTNKDKDMIRLRELREANQQLEELLQFRNKKYKINHQIDQNLDEMSAICQRYR